MSILSYRTLFLASLFFCLKLRRRRRSTLFALHVPLPIEGGDAGAAKTAEEWRQNATVHDGSWWEDWKRWLEPRSGEKRSEEHTSELQSRQYLVCRLLLEKKKYIERAHDYTPITPISHIQC